MNATYFVKTYKGQPIYASVDGVSWQDGQRQFDTLDECEADIDQAKTQKESDNLLFFNHKQDSYPQV